MAPNPTTGFMLIIPHSEMKHTTLTIEQAFQMIVSAGVVVPLTLKLPADIAQSSGEIDVDVLERATSDSKPPAS